MHNYKRLDEAFESRKWHKGEVKFSETKITDPHIQKILKETARITNVPIAEVEQELQKKIDSFKDIAAKAPILYGTILKNIVEDQAFNFVMDHKISSPTCPKFNKTLFFELVYLIKSDHEQFYPLRSFLNHKRLYDAVMIFTDNPDYPDFKEVETACATPKGIFAFNPQFCQHLMDMAHLKEVKPKGNKYECNGGDIPDEYCYIEFVIIHEFMHYTYDDFHYQKIIQNADPQIINWVGDFRTNYLLVKSGYEQLPMGLFNDDINYDRQDTYIQMYNLVKSEMENLSDGQKERVKDALDGMSDDHEPGQGQGKEMEEGKDGEASEKDIDEQHRKTEEQMKNGKDKTGKEANDEMRQREEERKKAAEEAKKKEASQKGGRGGGANGDVAIDYAKIRPEYNWREIIKQFITSANPETEDSYQKPSRRSISGIYTAAQTGKGAMKPGEVELELMKANLYFCIDSSGSMGNAIAKIYSNIYNLLKTHIGLQDCEMTLMKFSSDYDTYKIIFKGDRAVKVNSFADKPKGWNLKLSEVFKHHFGASTNFTGELVNELLTALSKQQNVLVFSDQDILTGENYKELLKLLNAKSQGKVFLIFDSKATYVNFLQKSKFSKHFITYLE